MKNWRLIFFDFEVKQDWWCVTFLEDEKYTTITDKLDLIDYILKNKDDSIFIGYNNKHFDNWCIKCIWYGINPYKVVHNVIKLNKKPWEIEEIRFKKNLDIITYDLMAAVGPMAQSLKEVEGNLGLSIILDKTIENEKESGLTKEELERMIEYNKHDVYTTRELYKHIHYELDALLKLIEYYNLPMNMLGKTKASILEAIYKNQIKKQLNPLTYYYKAPSFIHLDNDDVLKKIEEFEFTEDNKFNYDYPLDDGIYKIGRGGAHYARKKENIKLDKDHILICADYSSFYPNMMANKTNEELRYINPVLDWELFRGMIDLRLNEKKKGNEGDKNAKDMSNALKVPINGAFGKLIDKNSALRYWPSGLDICLTGQLITIMITQRLQKENIGLMENVNTDGFYYLVNSEENLEKFLKIMKEYEVITGIDFEFDIIKDGYFYQKDVNNYIIYDKEKDKIKVKGTMLNKYNGANEWFQNSLSIIDEALVNKLVYNKEIRSTIMDAYNKNEAKKFQMIYNCKGKLWEGVYYGMEKVQTINRGFASCDKNKPQLARLKNGTYWKYGDRPEHVIIYNDDLNGFDVRKIGLDIEWYVNLAEKRLFAFLNGTSDIFMYNIKPI